MTVYDFERLTREIYNIEPELLCEINDKFGDILQKSYSDRPGPKTMKAVKERLNIMSKWFQTFRRDLKWSRQRAYNHIGDALVAELDKDEYKPPREGKRSWGETGQSEKLVLELGNGETNGFD